MAQFRVLHAVDVVDILGDFGLPPDSYLGHEAIVAGTINTNLRVETVLGTRFLRVNEGKSADDVAREADIVAHAAAAGVATPTPYRNQAGQPYSLWQGQIVSLFPWLSGRTLARPEVTGEHARQVGSALGRLHRAGVNFPDHRPGRYEPAEIEGRIERVLTGAASDPALTHDATELQGELVALAKERAPVLPVGLIHGDLFIDNVLFDGPALVAFLDFEQASWGRLAYDLAVTALAFGFGRDDFRPEVLRALFEGYVRERPLGSEEREAFGAELRFAACRFAVTRITDVYLKRGAGAAPGKDYRRYLLRLARVREHLRAGDDWMRPPR